MACTFFAPTSIFRYLLFRWLDPYPPLGTTRTRICENVPRTYVRRVTGSWTLGLSEFNFPLPKWTITPRHVIATDLSRLK
jgi:hypothetical protein